MSRRMMRHLKCWMSGLPNTTAIGTSHIPECGIYQLLEHGNCPSQQLLKIYKHVQKNDATLGVLEYIAQWSRRGGLGHFGVKFFCCFFGLLWPSYVQRNWGKCNLPSGKANKGSESKPTWTQNANFTL